MNMTSILSTADPFSVRFRIHCEIAGVNFVHIRDYQLLTF